MTEQIRQLGNYRLVRLIGQGGFADVYQGEHIHLRTQAAIKVLQMRLGANSIQGFLEEARTIAHLVHPNIIRVLDFGVQNNIPFLVMDYAPRGTFRQRFLQGQPRALAGLIPYIRQAAEALQYAHDNNFIHRDVKPENMLLGPNDDVLLSDFGLALMTHNSASRTRTETAGTAAYMAPEQLQGRPRPASDQYALGVITYEWLTGTCPFVGSFFEIASQQVLGRPEPLHRKVSSITTQIEEVVLTALAKDPLRRYPNVKAFALALERACASEPVQDTTSKARTFDAAAFVQANTLKNRDTTSSANMTALPRVSGAMPAVDRTLLLNGPNGRTSTHSTSQKDVSTSRLQELNRSPLFDAGAVGGQSADFMNQSTRMRALPAANVESAPQTRRLLPAGNEEVQQPENSTRSRQLAPIPTYEEYMSRALQRMGQGSQNGQASFSSLPFPANFNQGSNQSSARFPDSTPSQVVLPPLLEPEELRIQPAGVSSGPISNSIATSVPNSSAFLPTPTSSLSGQHVEDRVVSPPPPREVVPQTREREGVGDSARFIGIVPGHGLGGRVDAWGPNRLLLLILAIIIILATLLSIVYLKRPTSTQNSATSTTFATTASTANKSAQATRAPGIATKNANPYPPYTGVLALNDPLLQNNNGWLEGAADGGSCRFTATGYQIYATLTTPPAVCFASATNFSDFTYEITMKFSTVGLKYSGGGIAFRANVAADSFYYFEVLDSKSYTLQSCINHVCKPLAGFPNSTQQFSFINTGNNAANKLAVVVIGDIYTFYVNDQLVVKYTDTNAILNLNGAIGVMATEGYDVTTERQQPTTALFNDVRVWR